MPDFLTTVLSTVQNTDALVELPDPVPWLELGISGAVLFIMLVMVLLSYYTQHRQSKDIQMLCSKIDTLVANFATTNNKLTEVLISNDKDQKQLISLLNKLNEMATETNSRLMRVDTRIYDYMKVSNHTRRSSDAPIDKGENS